MEAVGIVGVWYPRGAGYVCRTLRRLLWEQGIRVHVLARREERVELSGRWSGAEVTAFDGRDHRDVEKWAREREIGSCIVVEERDTALVGALREAGVERLVHLVMEDQIRERDLNPGSAAQMFDRTLIPGVHLASDPRLPRPAEMDWFVFEDEYPEPVDEVGPLALFIGGWSCGADTSRRKDADALSGAWRLLKKDADNDLVLTCLAQRQGDLHDWSWTDDVVCIERELPEGALRRMISTASFVVVPNRRDGLGLDVVDSIACGVPIVAPLKLRVAWKWAGNAGTWFGRSTAHEGSFAIPSCAFDHVDIFSALGQATENRHQLRAYARARRREMIDAKASVLDSVMESLS